MTQRCACAHEKQVLLLDEAPLYERAATEICAPSFRCVTRRMCGEGWGRQTFTQVSMVDVDIFQSIREIMSVADHARRTGERRGREQYDKFGDVHLILFGDFKRLP